MSTEPTATPNGTSDSVPTPLARAITEIERHVGADGWDQPARLYALAPTSDLVAREPDLAERLGLDPARSLGDVLTPIEQETHHRPVEDLLPTISWPDTVTGCALALERIVLPPGAENDMPAGEHEATAWAQRHPDRSDVRVVVGVLRDGTRLSVLRVRGHEADDDLIHGAELSTELGDALAETFA